MSTQVIICPHCGQDACGGPWPIDTITPGDHIFPCLHCRRQFVGWIEGGALKTRVLRADEGTPYPPPIRGGN
jgi:hypothetical protein